MAKQKSTPLPPLRITLPPTIAVEEARAKLMARFPACADPTCRPCTRTREAVEGLIAAVIASATIEPVT